MTYPASGTTGVALDQEIEVRFSEHINENTVGQAIFISPPLKIPPRIDTRGDRLIIKPEQPLDSGRTYVVSIAASLQDLRGNRLPSSINFAFSTGDVIDSAGVNGTVYRDYIPLSNFRVFAYEFTDTLIDSIFSIIPDYVTETGDSGDFRIEFMTPGEYLILAAQDKDRDNLINRAGEQIALPVSLATADTEMGSVSLHVTSFDSTSLKLINCSGVEGTVKLRFDAPLDSTTAQRSSITIIHSDTTLTVPAFWHQASASELHGFSGWFREGREFDVVVTGLISQTGRKPAQDSARCNVRINARDDGSPRPLGHYPSLRALIMPEETLRVNFSEPIRIEENSVILEMDTTLVDTVSGSLLDRLTFGFTVPDNFSFDRQIKATIDLSKVRDLYGNAPEDSVYTLSFMVANPDSLGSLSGSIIGAGHDLVIELSGQRNRFYYRFESVTDSAYSWTLYPDTYRITGYFDQNKDGRWNLGSIKPFRYAEPGWMADDSVRVRARFEHEGKVLRFE